MQPNLRTLSSGKTETLHSLNNNSPSCPPSQPLEHEAFLPLQLTYFLCICSKKSTWVFWGHGTRDVQNCPQPERKKRAILMREFVPIALSFLKLASFHSGSVLYAAFRGRVRTSLRIAFLCYCFKPTIFFNVFGCCCCYRQCLDCTLKPCVTWIFSLIISSFHSF